MQSDFSNTNIQQSRKECVEFECVKYYRYPDAEKWSQRMYYHAGRTDRQRTGKQLLHREIWKSAHGEIPSGYDIHHIDENPLNNDLGNLEALTKKEHRAKHPLSESALRWRREHADKIRPLTAEWHGSDEGLEWHKQHGAKSWENRPTAIVSCIQCGNTFEAHLPEKARFCSRRCLSTFHEKTKRYYEERHCVVCFGIFSVKASKKQEVCSRKCGWVVRRQKAA